MQTKPFEIAAFTPQFLLLRRFVDEAREDLRGAESHRDVLRYRNERRTEELAAAEGRVVQAQERLGDAEQALIAVKDDASFDVRDACRRAGVRYAWWPVDLYVDPRRHRYRGQPLTPEEVDEIGPVKLTRLINAGAIVVTAEMVPPGDR